MDSRNLVVIRGVRRLLEGRILRYLSGAGRDHFRIVEMGVGESPLYGLAQPHLPLL